LLTASNPLEGEMRMTIDQIIAILGIVIGSIVGLVSLIFREKDRASLQHCNILLEQSQKEVKDCKKELENQKRIYENQIMQLKSKNAELAEIEKKYQYAREQLNRSHVVQKFVQPVLLIGPRDVGKTSLMRQWHAPWETIKIERTLDGEYRDTEVPFYKFFLAEKRPHFAMEEVYTKVESQLILKVWDFPGETDAQEKIIEVAKEETEALQKISRRKDLGVVFICMFDAEEAYKGISGRTSQYYTGTLFSELRRLIGYTEICLERLILVFNKIDKLREHLPGKSEEELLDSCLKGFEGCIKMFKGICNPDQICEVLTVLDDKQRLKIQGTSVVKAETARGFVRKMASEEEIARLLPDQSSSKAARML